MRSKKVFAITLLILALTIIIGIVIFNSYSAEPQLKAPSSIDVDSSGNVFVADTGNSRIQKFSNIGIIIAKWGAFGTQNGSFSGPQGLAMDSSGNVFVADTGNNRIQKFSNRGIFIREWGTVGIGDGQFKFPLDDAVDKSGNVYVADTSNNRIQKFNNRGTFIREWGTFGSMSKSSNIGNLGF
jgi:tripartite motif-containing protein 71